MLNTRCNLWTKFNIVPKILAVYPVHSLGFELCKWITDSKIRYKILSERSSPGKNRPECAVPDAGGAQPRCLGSTRSEAGVWGAVSCSEVCLSQSQFEKPYLFYFLSQPVYHKTGLLRAESCWSCPLWAPSTCLCSFQVQAEPWLFD